jgi:hypothetical protein
MIHRPPHLAVLKDGANEIRATGFHRHAECPAVFCSARATLPANGPDAVIPIAAPLVTESCLLLQAAPADHGLACTSTLGFFRKAVEPRACLCHVGLTYVVLHAGEGILGIVSQFKPCQLVVQRPHTKHTGALFASPHLILWAAGTCTMQVTRSQLQALPLAQTVSQVGAIMLVALTSVVSVFCNGVGPCCTSTPSLPIVSWAVAAAFRFPL